MKTIWKYGLEIKNKYQELEIPERGKIKAVMMDGDRIGLWIKVESELGAVTRAFVVKGTGDEIQLGEKYIGTVRDGSFVWHVFEL